MPKLGVELEIMGEEEELGPASLNPSWVMSGLTWNIMVDRWCFGWVHHLWAKLSTSFGDPSWSSFISLLIWGYAYINVIMGFQSHGLAILSITYLPLTFFFFFLFFLASLSCFFKICITTSILCCWNLKENQICQSSVFGMFAN